MSPMPKVAHDLTLAPVAVAIDENLQRLRNKTSTELDFELALELDKPEFSHTREERAERIRRVSIRDVDLHGWNAEITHDGHSVHLSGGSVTIDIGLSAAISHFIDGSAD